MSKINYYFAKDYYTYKCDEIMYRWNGRRFDISKKYTVGDTSKDSLKSLISHCVEFFKQQVPNSDLIALVKTEQGID